jgi:hypothetical protein
VGLKTPRLKKTFVTKYYIRYGLEWIFWINEGKMNMRFVKWSLSSLFSQNISKINNKIFIRFSGSTGAQMHKGGREPAGDYAFLYGKEKELGTLYLGT